MLFGRRFVTPIVVEYLRRYPEVDVHRLFIDRIVNFVDEGIDVGIRIGELPASSLQAVPVGHVRRVVCASPAYLARHGVPATPADLPAHTVIQTTGISTLPEWRFLAGGEIDAHAARPAHGHHHQRFGHRGGRGRLRAGARAVVPDCR